VIETLDDIVEGLANALMVYGSCPKDDDGECPEEGCRSCWEPDMKHRLRKVFEVDKKLDSYLVETAKNIRRNLNHIRVLLVPGDDRDSQFIDLVNHIETLTQELESK